MNHAYALLFIILAILLPGCKKEQFPAAKPSSHIQPTTMPAAITTSSTVTTPPIAPVTMPSSTNNLNVQGMYLPSKMTLPHMNQQPATSSIKNVQPTQVIPATPTPPALTTSKQPMQPTKKHDEELDFIVENKTGTSFFVTCFAYLRRDALMRWRWHKTPVNEVKPNQSITVDVATIHNITDRKSVFGFLGLFKTQKEADDAIYELLQDEQKIDLDLLVNLKGKKVTIHVEQYGFKEKFYDFDFEPLIKKDEKKTAELDFYVHNNTNETLFICGFTYLKKAKSSWITKIDSKDDMSTWRYDKTPIIKIKPQEYGLIDIDTIIPVRDRDNVSCYLAIFKEDAELLANESTFELLDPKRKIDLGILLNRKPKMSETIISIEEEKYGILDDIIDYTIKPIKGADLSKAIR